MLADWFLCQSNIPGSRLLMGSSLYCTNFDPLFECAFLWCRRMVGPPFISLSFLGPLRTGKRRACCSMLVPTLMQQTWWVRLLVTQFCAPITSFWRLIPDLSVVLPAANVRKYHCIGMWRAGWANGNHGRRQSKQYLGSPRFARSGCQHGCAGPSAYKLSSLRALTVLIPYFCLRVRLHECVCACVFGCAWGDACTFMWHHARLPTWRGILDCRVA
jgi:hypothetical protein